MTPAEELAAAADKLEMQAALAIGGPWEVEAPGGGRAWINNADYRHAFPFHGFYDSAEYVATMNPLVGKALVELFRMEFSRIDATEKVHPPYVPDPEVLALARLINGGETNG